MGMALFIFSEKKKKIYNSSILSITLAALFWLVKIQLLDLLNLACLDMHNVDKRTIKERKSTN